jgi:hypothetical protein
MVFIRLAVVIRIVICETRWPNPDLQFWERSIDV